MEISINKLRCSTRLLMEHLVSVQPTEMVASTEYKVLQEFLRKKVTKLLNFKIHNKVLQLFQIPIGLHGNGR